MHDGGRSGRSFLEQAYGLSGKKKVELHRYARDNHPKVREGWN